MEEQRADLQQVKQVDAMVASPLDLLFNPKSVAIVGATPRENSVGGVITKNLLTKFKGKVYLVNPKYDEVNGTKYYKSVLDIQDNVDLAVIAVPAPAVLKVTEESIKKGVRVVIIISGGFSEVGEDGAKLEEELRRVVQNHIRVLGPNCIGVYNAFNGLDTFFLPEDRMGRPRPGPVALISQSGAVAGAILDWAARRNIGVGLAVNYGNKLDISESEILEYFARDNRVKVIVMYMEGLKYPGEGKKLLEVMKEVSSIKPIVVYKAGRTKAATGAVKSHTAALAGNYEIYHAMLRQANVIEADNITDAFDMAKALATQPLPRGNRVLVLTDSGGMGIQAVDALDMRGLQVPELSESLQEILRKQLPPLAVTRNPIDLTGSATDAMYKFVLDTVLPTSYADMALIIALMQIPGLSINLGNYIVEAGRFKKPIVVVSFGGNEYVAKFENNLEENGIPVYHAPHRAAKALWALYEYAKIKGVAKEW
ncbi:acetate--CoA ligase family protein [Vulcanisaeta souniana]|uniref:CoA-binding protein n=1 Tax=Vulcanisaeta souniana JCM 11219 TaxID=1293586 RepID=A0A830E919_9CREN|nr:CoA-binding protein [Vulcanisaeta souniana]BDR93034.1 CoA-binding protein [Vulcanisaeta souniana JCM 11219]GGI83418.1 CoA-binding protein [Vulcanisaeta souniana JCM 11219]